MTNIFDYTAIASGNALDATTGTLTANVGYDTSPLMVVVAGTVYTTNQNVFFNNNQYGYAWYDSTGAFLSGVVGTTHQLQPVTFQAAPAGATGLRFCWENSVASPTAANAVMVVQGTSVPGTYIPYTAPSGGGGGSTPINIFNYAADSPGYALDATTGAISANAGYDSSPIMAVTAGSVYTTNQNVFFAANQYGYAWYNSSGTFISGVVGTTHQLGPFTFAAAPAGATGLRFCWENSVASPKPANQVMVVLGTTVPSSYVAYTAPGTPPTITFSIPAHQTGDAPFNVAATSNSPGAITYTISSGPATISGNSVTVTGAGTVVVQASQVASGSYASTNITASFAVTAPSAVNGYTLVSASKLSTDDGTLINNAVLTAQPVTNTGVVTSFRNGAGGQNTSSPISVPVVNGAFSHQLADTSQTQPSHIGYRITVKSTVTGAVLLSYPFVQPSGNTWSFDNYDPSAGIVPTGNSSASAPGGFYLGVGNVTTLSAGSTPTVSITGSSGAQLLNFGFPAASSSGGSGGVALPSAGKKLGFIGDSITAWFSELWQTVVTTRSGTTMVFQDSRGGRRFDQSLECYGTVTPGAALTTYDSTRSPLIDQTNFAYYDGAHTRARQISTVGNTLAQNIAQVDLMIVRLGTNDMAVTVGTLGDATNANTLYGNMRWLIEDLLTAKPTLRIIMVGPNYRTDFSATVNNQTNAACKAFAAAYGIPYLDVMQQFGISAYTSATLLRDAVHPTDFTFNTIDGPAVAQFIERFL